MTTLDIIDTAVKIGLGAAIAAVATYVNDRATFRRDLRKQEVQRRLELVERIVKHLDEFNLPFLDYMCSCPVVGELTAKSAHIDVTRVQLQRDMTAEDQVAFEAKAARAREAVKELTTALSLLNLLGSSKALTALFTLKNESEKLWLRTAGVEGPIDINDFLDLRKTITTARREFYESIREVYSFNPRKRA